MPSLSGLLAALLGASLAVSGGVFLLYRAASAERDAARLEVSALEDANQTGREAIAQLETERDQLAIRLEEQRAVEDALRRDSRERLAAVSRLAREDTDVETFIDLRTPADLCRLHAPAGREADCADGDGEGDGP